MSTPSDSEQPLPFGDQLRRLCAERGTNVERVWAKASGPDSRGPSLSTLRKAMAGQRPVTMHLIESMARALDVEPTVFAQYRLALARQLFDENAVGLDIALLNLGLLEEGLVEAAEEHGDSAAARALRRIRHSRPKPAE